ncbi:hypothetical protein ACVW00_004392 [Marmoricola sp. URHA0025 HA25]
MTTTTQDPKHDTRTGKAVATGAGRPIVSLGELQRAWEAVQSGRFRSTARPGTAGNAAASPSSGEWFAAETVIPIIGAGGSVGATILALALATVSTSPARVVECCSASASGLASASTAELGATGTGWRRGLRDGLHHRILLERAAERISTAAAVPLPTDPDRPVAVTFLDCGWDLDHLLADGWLAELVATAPVLVVATTATVPGMRRLEVALDALQAAAQVTVAVLGPRRKKWGRPVEGSLGPAIRALDAVDGLVEIPLDRDLSVYGPTSTPLPQPLLSAAGQLRDRLPAPATALAADGFDTSCDGVDHEPLVEGQDR